MAPFALARQTPVHAPGASASTRLQMLATDCWRSRTSGDVVIEAA
jgi:hypothetical protein